jgi:hypothetical protein
MPRLSTTANGAVRRVTPRPAGRPAGRPGRPPSTAVEPERLGPVEPLEQEPQQEDFVEESLEEGDALPSPMASGPVRGDPQVVEAFGPNGELLTLELGKDGVYRTVQTNVPPPPVSAEVDHPLLTTLRSRTNQPKQQAKRLPAYNNPYLWYMKTDGEVVQLQGDPGNRAYYEEKGYVVLRPEEVALYLKDTTRSVPDGKGGFKKEILQPAIRRLVLAEQRRRAELITTIRNIAAKNPAVELAGDLSITPTDELEGLLAQLKGNQSIHFTLLEARHRGRTEDDDDTEMVAGIEMQSGVELERKLEAYNQARSQNQLTDTRRLNPALAE